MIMKVVVLCSVFLAVCHVSWAQMPQCVAEIQSKMMKEGNVGASLEERCKFGNELLACLENVISEGYFPEGIMKYYTDQVDQMASQIRAKCSSQEEESPEN